MPTMNPRFSGSLSLGTENKVYEMLIYKFVHFFVSSIETEFRILSLDSLTQIADYRHVKCDGMIWANNLQYNGHIKCVNFEGRGYIVSHQ